MYSIQILQIETFTQSNFWNKSQLITDCLNINDTQKVNHVLTYLEQQPNVMESETCCLKPTHCSCLLMSVKVQNRI